MRAEGPKERPTAVLCVQLSARYVEIRQTAKIRNYYYYYYYYYLYNIGTDTERKKSKGKRANHMILF